MKYQYLKLKQDKNETKPNRKEIELTFDKKPSASIQINI